MISLKNVEKKYGHLSIINNLNITIDGGHVIGLVGPNGAGKTTTINMILGLIPPTRGTIEILGKTLEKNSLEIKKNIGYVSDNSNVFLKLKGIEYLNFIADIYKISTSERKKTISYLAEIFEMTNHLNKKIETYSKGMKQKITIISSLLHSPKIWILDEPFNGLDTASAFTLKKFMKEYSKKGNIVLVSSHLLDVIDNLCDEFILINNGHLLFFGTLQTFKSYFDLNKSLENIYMEVINNNESFNFT